MAGIPGSVRVAGVVAPTDSTDTYAVTDEFYNKGGMRSVLNRTELETITNERRKLGMLVYVLAESMFYQLLNTLDNTGWEPVSLGNVVVKRASVPLGGGKLVTTDNVGQLVYADKDLNADVLGMTMQAANTGESVFIKTFGELQDPSWTFVSQSPLFLGNLGQILQAAPTIGTLVPIGKALTADRVFIHIQTAIKLI